MVNSEYATRVLFALSFKDLCGYQLSKSIATKGEKISNGTIGPVLSNLHQDGFIDFRMSGNRKVYTLTGKGDTYVREVRAIRNELKSRIFVDSLNENAIYLDFLSNLEDMKVLRELLEFLGDEIMSIVRSGFAMQKSGDDVRLGQLKEKLGLLEREVARWRSQEAQS